MNKQLEYIFNNFGKLGFGYALSAGLGGIFFILLKLYSIEVEINDLLFIHVFGLLGLGIYQLIDKLIAKTFLLPIVKFLNFYFKIGQLLILRRSNFFSNQKIEKISDKLLEKYFLNEILEYSKEGLSKDIKSLPMPSEGDDKLDLDDKKPEKEKVRASKKKKDDFSTPSG